MAAPPKKPHLRERYDERQREVLDTCAGVLARHGYHGTSIDDLIAATGLTRGGLYHYIGSKPELLSRVLADLMAPLLEQARPIVDGPDAPATAIERLRALTRLWMTHVEQHQDHVTVFLQERHTLEQDPSWDEVRGDRDAFEALLTTVLEQGVADGELRLDDPGLTALGLLGMVNHSVLWFRRGGRLSAQQVADGFVDLLLDGIRT